MAQPPAAPARRCLSHRGRHPLSPGTRDLDALVGRVVDSILASFRAHGDAFRRVTLRARMRFENRDWVGAQADARERLELYPTRIASLEREIADTIGAREANDELWPALKRAYSERIHGTTHIELARTFFNSVVRRLLTTVGVQPDTEFVATEATHLEPSRPERVARRYEPADGVESMLAEILRDQGFAAPFRSLDDDVRRGAARLRDQTGTAKIELAELIDTVFYRNKGAYLVGRLVAGEREFPLVLPLLHGDDGIALDAVLTDEDEASIVFSFTRSYFNVATQRPRDVIAFLMQVLPKKPIAELNTSLGFHKRGKTELYRSLQEHLRGSNDRFELAEGDQGMVMLVFVLTGLDIVFKVIRDRFAYPKTITRQRVIDRYRLVFRHDRVGRLIDAQEFKQLEFDRERFSDELLDILLNETADTVRLEGDRVVVSHLYTERRITPLNVYLRQAETAARHRALIDYGAAIKELAAANIFPGDFLLKNFGVTRHGRVVFYDYDELCHLEDCRFRKLPPARNPEDEMAAEPWYSVAENDVFPEEFPRFLGLTPDLRRVFDEHHADLFTAEFWCDLQRRHAEGEILDVLPYPQSRRL
ncbi:MAG: bifunctional isocitrate dehydrogenase kinase/phosphatase [bacterium]|nr:bifunctional isocitrate dehydrogenase kinase/phosphatase [bacterium]